jgi:hypothetical protein
VIGGILISPALADVVPGVTMPGEGALTDDCAVGVVGCKESAWVGHSELALSRQRSSSVSTRGEKERACRVVAGLRRNRFCKKEYNILRAL